MATVERTKMKRIGLWITLALMFVIPVGLGGCQTKSKAPDTKSAAPAKETGAATQPAAEKSAAEKAAMDKPKDHPAH